MKPNLSSVVSQDRLCLPRVYEDTLIWVPPKFVFLALMIRSMIYFKLYFVYNVRLLLHFILFYMFYLVPVSSLAFPFPTELQRISDENQVSASSISELSIWVY